MGPTRNPGSHVVAGLGSAADLPRHLPLIRQHARWFCRNTSLEADDFVQEVCCRVMTHPPEGLPDDDALRAWLFVVARNVRKDRLRYDYQPRRYGTMLPIDKLAGEGEEPTEAPSTPGGQIEHVLLAELLARAPARLCDGYHKSLSEALGARRWRALLRAAAGETVATKCVEGRYTREARAEKMDVDAARRILQEEFAP